MGSSWAEPHLALFINICIAQSLSGTCLFAQTDETQATNSQWSMPWLLVSLSQQTAQPQPQATVSHTHNKYIH